MDPLNPSVTVTLDKERHLVYDVDAHIAFEEVTGKQLLTVVSEIGREVLAARQEGREPDQSVFPLHVQRALLYAGLISETLDENCRPTADTLSLRQLSRLLPTPMALVPYLTEAAKALNASIAVPEDEAVPQKAPARKRNHSSGAVSVVSLESTSGLASASSAS